MKFYSKNPIQDFFREPISFPSHVYQDSDNGDNSSFLLISQDANHSDSENSPSIEIGSSTNESSVRVEQPRINEFSGRREWQTIKGSFYLKQSRKRQAVKVEPQYKNFLVNMKGAHFRWPQKDMGPIFHELVQNNVFLKTLRDEKGHMAMPDYEEFYKIEEIQESLGKCFRKGYLFREMMLSKIKPENKKKFLRKIKMLEGAFRKKELKSLRQCQRKRREIQEGNIPLGSFVRQNPQGGGEHRS